MIEAFNAQTAPLVGIWPGIAAGVLLAGCALWRFFGRKLKWYIPAAIVLVAVLASGIPVWDQMRIRSRLASGEGLEVTRGKITQLWRITNRVRDTTRSSTSYKTVVSEGFDIGADRFSWVANSCISHAALCALDESRIPLREGMEVEVTWFTDPAQQDERRILKLLVWQGASGS